MRRTNVVSILSLLLILAGFGVSAQTISINSVSDATPCAGDTIIVSCTASQVMNFHNTFRLELSTVADNFSNPATIGMFVSVSANVNVTGVIPANITQDQYYLLRIVSTAPAITSHSEPVFVEQSPGVMAGSNSPVIAGDTLLLDATSDPGATYIWHHPDGVSTAAQQNHVVPSAASTDAGDYTVEVTATNGCTNTATVAVEIHAYEITIPTLAAHYCEGANALVGFSVSRDFSNNNIFIAQLSDITGSFEHAVEIGQLQSRTSDSIRVTFPANLTGGTGYRIRIVASAPAAVSSSSPQFHLRLKPQPYVHANGPLTFCEGGSVTFTAFNGANYLWSNGSHEASIIAAQTGNYALTMTDYYGCVGTVVKSVVVHEPNNAYIIHVGSTELCEGESVRLVAYDGASYHWSNGASTQSITVDDAGSYSVTVTNSNGCSKAANAVSVTVLPAPDVTLSHTGTVDVCTGESIMLSLTGGYENYFWNTGDATASINVNTEGDFSATVFDENGCSVKTDTVHVNVHETPGTPEVTYNSGLGELFCTPGQFYQWYKNGVAIEGAIYHHLLVRGVDGLQEGTYTAEVSNVHGCSKMSSTYELFEVISGITQKEKRILSLYPNPNNGVFELNIPENAGMHIVVTNSIGSVVYDAENSFERSQIDLTHLKSGVYFLKAFDEKGVSSVVFLKN